MKIGGLQKNSVVVRVYQYFTSTGTGTGTVFLELRPSRLS
jgi:hypothetical protein